MSKSTIFSDAIHILVYITSEEQHELSSKAIANSLNTNPALVRKIMKLLREAKIIQTVQGKSEPKLCMTTKELTLKEIYLAVCTNPLLKPDYNTANFCPIGKNIVPVLETKFAKVHQSMLLELNQISLQEVIDDIDAIMI